MKTNDPKKEHDKDAGLPVGEAPGADLVSRPEKNERGGSAPGAELAPRPETGPKPPVTKDEADRARTSSSSKAGALGSDLGPVAAGAVRCRVTGGGIKYHGRRFEEGTIADFDEKTVREMSSTLVPIDQVRSEDGQE